MHDRYATSDQQMRAACRLDTRPHTDDDDECMVRVRRLTDDTKQSEQTTQRAGPPHRTLWRPPRADAASHVCLVVTVIVDSSGVISSVCSTSSVRRCDSTWPSIAIASLRPALSLSRSDAHSLTMLSLLLHLPVGLVGIDPATGAVLGVDPTIKKVVKKVGKKATKAAAHAATGAATAAATGATSATVPTPSADVLVDVVDETPSAVVEFLQSLDPTLTAIVVGLVIILAFVIYRRRFSSTGQRGDTFLLLGSMGAGKTCLYYQLKQGICRETHTSMKANEATFVVKPLEGKVSRWCRYSACVAFGVRFAVLILRVFLSLCVGPRPDRSLALRRSSWPRVPACEVGSIEERVEGRHIRGRWVDTGVIR
jgi:hypothetical protein